jgi:hypothetical protein
MYSRSNCDAIKPGEWISGDGEYGFTREGKSWICIHRAAWTATEGFHFATIGSGPTLESVFRIAARHYVTPAGTWQRHEESTGGLNRRST